MYNLGNCTNCITCGDCQRSFESDSPTLFCMHCDIKSAPCLFVCEMNAIFQLGGAITRNNEKCDKCGECVKVCPINIINI